MEPVCLAIAVRGGQVKEVWCSADAVLAHVVDWDTACDDSDSPQLVEIRVGGELKRAWVEQDPREAVITGVADPVDQRALVIALATLDDCFALGAGGLEPFVNFRERGLAVDIRLALAEPIEVRSAQNQYAQRASGTGLGRVGNYRERPTARFSLSVGHLRPRARQPAWAPGAEAGSGPCPGLRLASG